MQSRISFHAQLKTANETSSKNSLFERSTPKALNFLLKQETALTLLSFVKADWRVQLFKDKLNGL